MERKLVSIQQVAEIAPIVGADKIEAVRINGWWIVAKCDEFKVNDLCVFAEIDSFLPHTIAPFLTKPGHNPKIFNNVEGQRLRTVRLRGQLSQGLVLPLTCNEQLVNMTEANIDDDVTELLGVQKWEAPIAACLQGQAKGNFPGWIQKTDQIRCQSIPRQICDEHDAKSEFEITIKLDGTSGTFFKRDDEIGVCSRNLQLKVNLDNLDNLYIKTGINTGLLDALEALNMNIAVQSEIMGEKVQKNREHFTEHKMFVFDIFNIDTGTYFSTVERLKIMQQLRDLGFTGDHVPIIAANATIPRTVDELLAMAEGPSINNPIREGLVFKRVDGQFSFKAISNKFLLDIEKQMAKDGDE